MTELKVDVSPDDLFKQLGQAHVAIAQMRSHNQDTSRLQNLKKNPPLPSNWR